MARRNQKKLKLFAESVNGEDRTATEDGKDRLELQTWSDLPLELLNLIMSRLTLEDNIRASSVCKRWHNVAVSVRVMYQSPRLMSFPKYGNLYEFYDPSERETYSIELPELHGSRVCCTKDGWLLLYRAIVHQVFFFNPFNRELIKLPSFELSYQTVAFSCAPTSTGCVIVTITLDVGLTDVAISMCHPGASEWTTVNHQNHLPFVGCIWNRLVFCSGMFYWVGVTSWLGVYDPKKRTWNVLAVHPPRRLHPATFSDWWKRIFIAEHNGDILIIYTCCTENPIVFKLDRSKMVWQETQNLGGVTLFVGFLSSLARTNLPGPMRNSVYFSKVFFLFGKRCISYSLDDGSYYPLKRLYDWGKEDPFENIWIEPPQDASSFI
ncbi:hypothetical protein DITRI_Ditri06bG0043400 [Diplodiscus trichospermus]